MAGADTVRTPKKESGDAVDKTPPTFTLDDLLAQLGPEDVGEDGLTITEICEHRGLAPTASNRAKVYRQVKDLVALELWEYRGKKGVKTVTGAVWQGAAAWGPVSPK